MKQFKVIMAVVVLTASILLLFSQLFDSQPIQIILETGQEVTTQYSGFFSLSEVLLLIIASFLVGSTSLYLYYNSDTDVLKTLGRKGKESGYDLILPLLKGDEKAIFKQLMDSKGGMLQNKLVLETGLTKVKMTRVLSRLESKQLIVKERYGLTNKIRLK